MNVRAVAKAFAICQFENVSILLVESKIPRLHCLLLGYSNKRRANQGCT